MDHNSLTLLALGMFVISALVIFAGGLVLRLIYLHGDFGKARSYIWRCKWIILMMAAGAALLYALADGLDIHYVTYLPPAVVAAGCVLLGRGVIIPLFHA